MEYIKFLVLGAGSGAVIAAVSLGLTLTYRASGVINFSQGAMAAWIAYSYSCLTTEGTVPLFPLPFVPSEIYLGGPFAPVAALLIASVTALIWGLLLYVLVFRPLRQAPALAKIVASVGVMLVVQTAIVINFGAGQRMIEPIFPSYLVQFQGISIGADRLFLVTAVLVTTGLLHLLYSYTPFGIKTRAAAENEKFAILSGIPVDRLAAANWMLATLLAGTAAIMVAPITGLTASGMTLIIVPALAAAVISNFSSFWIAAISGLLLGMAQSGLMIAQLKNPWWPDVGLDRALPFLVIITAMLLTGRSLPSRGAIEARRLPEAYAPQLTPMRTALLAVLVLAAATASLCLPYQYRIGLNNTYIGILLALSLVVITGFAGQLALAQMIIAGIAAFGFATFQSTFGLSFLPAALLAIACAGSTGMVFAIPALRTRGASLAIVTLAGGMALQQTVLTRAGWFGAVSGRQAEPPEVLGITLGPQSLTAMGDGNLPDPAFGLALLVCCIAACIAVARLRRSRLGAAMLAVRSNEQASASVGLNVPAIKVAAFGMGGLLAGIAGVAIAINLGNFTARSFDIFASLGLLAVAYLGGIATVGGAIWAGSMYVQGIFVVLIDQLFHLGRYEGYVAGISLVVTAVFYGEGLDGANRALGERVATIWSLLTGNKKVPAEVAQ